jgi:hypothetical protein
VKRHDAPHVRTEIRKEQFAVDKDKESVDIGEEDSIHQSIHTILEPTGAPRDAFEFRLTELIIRKTLSTRTESG